MSRQGHMGTGQLPSRIDDVHYAPDPVRRLAPRRAPGCRSELASTFRAVRARRDRALYSLCEPSLPGLVPGPRHALAARPHLSRAAVRHRTVMVKDAAGSQDGWFWSNPSKGQCVTDNHAYPFDYPLSGFGLYCVRCHAAAHSYGAEPADTGNEFTFASLRNLEVAG